MCSAILVYFLSETRIACIAPCFECWILALYQNSCAYLENREHYSNHIYTWAVGGSHHSNDSNFQTIWIHSQKLLFSFRIGCLQQLAQAASECSIVDCAQAPTRIPFFFMFTFEKTVSTSHYAASSFPTLRKRRFMFIAIRGRWFDLEVRTTEVWVSDHSAWHV